MANTYSGGSADPRELIPTGKGVVITAGTVAEHGTAPARRPAPVTIEAVREEDRPRFALLAVQLDHHDVPRQCWDGGPIDAVTVERVIAANANLGVGDMRYPLYRVDQLLQKWRDAPKRTESERHRVNCMIEERWTMRAMAVATPDQLPALERMRERAGMHLLAQEQREAVCKPSALKANARSQEVRKKKAAERRAKLNREFRLCFISDDPRGAEMRRSFKLGEYVLEMNDADLRAEIIEKMATTYGVKVERMQKLVRPLRTLRGIEEE